jgi:hypothetical protein
LDADTVNNHVINTEGTPNGLAGNPFNQTTMVIATADRGINQRIRDAVISAGYSGDVINTQVFPSSMPKMGLENGSGDYMMVIYDGNI